LEKGTEIQPSNLEKWIGSVILFEVGEHEGYGRLWKFRDGFCLLYNPDKKI